MRKPGMTRAIIFDLYFTLVRFELAELETIFEHVRAMLGLELDSFEQSWQTAYVRYECGDPGSFDELLRALGRECGASLAEEDVAACAMAWRDFQRRALEVPHDVLDTLAELRERGYKLGLISNTMADVPPLWRASPAMRLFDAAVFSCEFGLRKPAPEIYLHACELIDVQPAECVFVGDGGGQELAGAERVGMRAVQLRWPDEPPEMDARLHREPWGGASIAALPELLSMLSDISTPSYPARTAAAAPSSHTTPRR
jgi:putative hydrolase of the HAD superfamily